MKLFFPIVFFAFFCELVDSSIGMGYGTTLTPLLLLLGFEPMEIVPAVLLSEFCTGVMAGVLHHEFGNANLRPGSQDFNVMAALAGLSVVGVIIGVLVTLSIPQWVVKFYIGAIVLIIGLAILLGLRGNGIFSWRRVVALGLLAAFNKGISGGGYGPVVTGGQVLSGIKGRNAVAISSMAEGITSAVGAGIYLFSDAGLNLELAPSLILGAILSVPLAAYIVSRVTSNQMAKAVGVVSTALGSYTLIRVLF